MSQVDCLLPEGEDLAFGEINAALGRGPDELDRRPQGRPLASTVVTVGTNPRLNEAAQALVSLRGHLAVRAILISVGNQTRPVPRRAGDTVALSGLAPSFVNNAVAALRLSSLPTIVWWRGERQSGLLEALASLADRVVLDDDEPLTIWQLAAPWFDTAAFSDLRWTRLTRWRTLMANFFDIPAVQAASSRFDRLRITSADPIAGNLFAAWLARSLNRTAGIDVEIVGGRQGAFIEEIRFGDGNEAVLLRLAPSGTCVQTCADVRGHRSARGTVSLGDQSLPALMTEELRIRARDRAFESAALACVARDGFAPGRPGPGPGRMGRERKSRQQGRGPRR